MTNAAKKMITDYENPEYILRPPGAGAIKFASRYIENVDEYYDCLDVLEDVIDGHVAEIEDKRVKRCGYCGFLYRDESPKNNRRTCSDECKAEKDHLAKKIKRYEEDMQRPDRRKKADELYYYSHYEYSFWNGHNSDLIMQEFDRKRGSILLGDKFEAVAALEKKRQDDGGKRVHTDNVRLYESDWSNRQQKPSKEFYGDTKPDATKVSVENYGAGEVERYLEGKYSERKLQEARRRAIEFERSRKKS